MAKKTFKIGEYSRGGIITAETTKTQVKVILKEWDTSTGFNKGSDQSNAKEYNRLEVDIDDSDMQRKITLFLLEDTTSYYTDTILEWILSKIDVKKKLFW